MVEFDYKIDYKNTLFRPNDRRYRIGRGEQGVLLVRPYTDVICKHWRFKTLKEAKVSSQKIFDMYLDYRIQKDFVGMDMCRKFLEMGFPVTISSSVTKSLNCLNLVAAFAFSLVAQSFSCGNTFPSLPYFFPSL